jgi:ferritin-like metal-binding protein YciE
VSASRTHDSGLAPAYCEAAACVKCALLQKLFGFNRCPAGAPASSQPWSSWPGACAAWPAMARTSQQLLVKFLSDLYSIELQAIAQLVSAPDLAGDPGLAADFRTQREMMQRLERGFDAAESASHRETPADELDKHVRRHLAEAHALECQSIQLLKKAAGMVNEPEIGQVYQGHLDETRDQIARVEQRLRSLGSSPSTFRDAVLKLGGLGWGWFFQAQSDSPSKLAAFAYAVEHLEIAGYELLRRTARRAQDTETEELCRHILEQERSMAERLAEKLELSVQATLRAVLV